MKQHISNVSDSHLWSELEKCGIAKVLLSRTAYKKQWSAYEKAIKSEMSLRNVEFNNLSDDELLKELGV